MPPAETEIDCGDGRHLIRWENGALTLPAHADTDAELVLAALGGDKPRCVELAELWARHHDDLDLLALGPRWDGDEILISWEDAEAARSGWQFPRGRPMRPARPGSSSGPPAAMRSQFTRARTREFELVALLTLGPALQLRLTASAAAAWPDQQDTQGTQSKQGALLTAALTGRLAPIAESWLGIDPELVTARPHDGPGWGELELTAPSAHAWRQAGHGLRASLPVDWLARVWAPGLALIRRHFVVAVLEARWPDARVLALTAPGADPVTLGVRASGDRGTPGGSAHWEITDTGEEAART